MTIPKVLHTKITPPVKSARTLPRPRVSQALAEALNYRLTLLQAGAGYGKTTALAVLAEEIRPLIWYQVMEEDSDPLIFLLHLCRATQLALPGLRDLPLPFLDAWDGSRGPLPSAGIVDQCLNAFSTQLDQPVLLVIDDVHLVAPAAVAAGSTAASVSAVSASAASASAASASEIALILDRLIGKAPHHLHVLLAGRPPVGLPNLSRWRAQGEVLTLDQSALAFNAAEIAALFAQHYAYELTPGEVEALLINTEGWAIALQLIWQSLRSGTWVEPRSKNAETLVEPRSKNAETLGEALARPVSSLDSLFDLLAHEVFAGQPADVQDFLLISATLREMTSEACDALRSRPGSPTRDSAAMLAYLRRQELFLVNLGDGTLRYHHIFHAFLRQQATPEQSKSWHTRAADYFRGAGNLDLAIYHLLQAGDQEAAAVLLDRYGAKLVAKGHLDRLATYLDSLQPETLRQHPALLSYLGDLARLHSRFEEALGWYQQAEALWGERGQLDGVARALRGQARIYLDTVNPTRAEELLQKSIRLTDSMEELEAQARLYELLAENKLNAGRPEEAERLRQQAAALRSEGPSDSQTMFRVLLRTGRLDEARLALEARAADERQAPVHTPRAHRETLLLLSLIYSFQGQGEAAYDAALEGTRRGIDLQSPFVTAVGYMRQGHALMLLGKPDAYSEARGQFEKTVEISRALAVSRLRVEAYWGLCRAAGYQGDLTQTLQYAQEGVEIGSQAGDEWVASLVRVAMGASLVLAARYEAAEEWLNRAARGFLECSDPFGRAAARLWQCLAWLRQKDDLRLAQNLPEVLAACRQGGYDFLFTRPSLLGPPDERILIPLLIAARDAGWESTYATHVLHALGLAEITFHPGYRLRVTTLGGFGTWRGAQMVPSNSWRREKARQLFQLLLTYRSAALDRDQITEFLWPEQDPATAQRNFKVTLNTLYHVLEPEREPGKESAYIVREGSTYGLRPAADLWLDADAFVAAVRQAEACGEQQPEGAMAWMEEALRLYGGEYLPDARYETWAAAEREHLAVLFLRTADRLSELLLGQGRPEEAIQLCQRILAHDNCWERAYRHLMLAYDRLGDHGQVARTYQRCLQTLQTELDVRPAAETEGLYRRLTNL